MGAAEVILLLIGIVVFIASFVIQDKKVSSEQDNRFTDEQIKELVEKEMKLIQEKMEAVVTETITYAVEKTERALERLTNEKIMAINEYSDTVLKEINRNHEEVVFLYDMLNDKHTGLKNMVKEVTKTATEIKETVKDAELTMKDLEVQEQKIIAQKDETVVPKRTAPKKATEKKPVEKKPIEKKVVTKKAATEKKAANKSVAEKNENSLNEQTDVSIQFAPNNEGSINNNEKILAMHKTGKSNMAIAKELSLGLGEVKLVIDLFDGM